MLIKEELIQALQDAQVNTHQPLILGVSGGADSLTLMHAVFHAGYPVVIAHLNHQLRDEADQDAEFVKSVAAKLGLPYIQDTVNIKTCAAEQKQSIEEAARNARYEFLFAAAEEKGAQAVLVAHTADDQAETILMHLLRGAGLDGLRGMLPRQDQHNWHPTIPLIRPLLNVWRKEIETYCLQQNLSPIQDSSNHDTTFFRNRLRHELIPILQSYNPQIKQRLSHTAKTIRAEIEIIQPQVDEAWDKCLHTAHPAYVDINLSEFKKQPIAIQRRLARKAIALQNLSLRDIGFAAIERLLNFIQRPTNSNQIELIANFNALIEDNSLFIFQNEAELPHSNWPQHFGQPIDITGNLNLNDGWEFTINKEIFNTNLWNKIKTNKDINQAWIHVPAGEILQVRNANQGEKFKPFGLGGHSTKISDYFINQKIPQRARKHWPILATQKEVVWISGLRIAETYQVTEQSETIFHIRLIKKYS